MKVASLPAQVVDRLFMVLSANFAHRWSSAFPNDAAISVAKAEWGKRLAGLTNEQISRGLDVLAESGKEWPPSIPEFRGMCLSVDEQALAPMYNPWRRDRAITDEAQVIRNRIAASNGLSEINKILKGRA